MIRLIMIIVLSIYVYLLYNEKNELEKKYKQLLNQSNCCNVNNADNEIIEKVSYNLNNDQDYFVDKVCSSNLINCNNKNIIKTIYKVAKKHSIDPYLFLSLIHTESSLNIYAKNGNYHGLGQIPLGIYEPETNLELSAVIFKYHYKKTKNIKLAITNYKGYNNINNQVIKVMNIYNTIKY